MRPWILLAVAVLSLGGFYTLSAMAVPSGRDAVVQDARERYIAATSALNAARLQVVTPGILGEIERSDPQETGLVGIEWSSYTTTSGDLAAKRLSTSPEWVEVFIEWFRELGLENGDRVGIGASGSFPALALSARIAAESMGLEPVVIASLTSSTWGANVPGFDLWDMENILVDGGHVTHTFRLLSLGGDGDKALHLFDEDRDFLFRRLAEIEADSRDVEILRPVSTAESIDRRMAVLFPDGEDSCRVFLNIGGHAANFGSGVGALSVPPGLTVPRREGSLNWAGDSVLFRTLQRNVPVIHILDIRGLASRQGVSINFDLGHDSGRLTHPPQARYASVIMALILTIGLCIFYPGSPRGSWKHYLKGKHHL
ncbi:MAG: poly-gamma-glutamate system protein [Candidatus Sumerlaeia bacterium]|nr:poly-gamma-glutamate system protein [Candidatus Sumerlaeia bacterium]